MWLIHDPTFINKQLITKTSKIVKQSSKHILVMKKKPFRKRSKSKTSSKQPNLRNHYQKDVQRLQTWGTLTTICKSLAL
jgi:hypothetical protein